MQLHRKQNSENMHFPEGNYNSQSIPTRVSSDSVSYAETVSPTLRSNILQGKDINLASLIMQREVEEERVTNSEGRYILFKQNQDARLLRNLTLNGFIIAFSKYENIMCEIYPSRRQKSNAYEQDIVEMASTTRGSAFYEYHNAFSAQASAVLL